MTWLVTGGAGYIGAHVVRALALAGLRPVVLDNLSSGKARFVPAGVPLVEADVNDTSAVAAALRDHAVDGIVHVAGFKYAGVSVQRPLHTYRENVTGMMSVLEAAHSLNVDKVVFSSSAAVYGTPDADIVTEDAALHPESPYGESKLIGEWLLADQARAVEGFRSVSLRYFNVVGSGTSAVWDASPHNLFPLVIDALLEGKTPRINGIDYPTPDGTCVRDYVHVSDVAASHATAAAALMADATLAPAYNLGSGVGLSVRQIMDAMVAVTGIDFTPEIGPRRAGDPPRIVANGDLAARDLDWAMRHDVESMVASAWNARKASLGLEPTT